MIHSLTENETRPSSFIMFKICQVQVHMVLCFTVSIAHNALQLYGEAKRAVSFCVKCFPDKPQARMQQGPNDYSRSSAYRACGVY